MAALISAGHCSLLPPNRQLATISTLAEKYPDCYVIHDGDEAVVPSHVKSLDVGQLAEPEPFDPSQSYDSPLIDDSQLAAISFTSGSTGESKPNRKTWSNLRQGIAINRENMLIQAPPQLHMLATVPPQHMYGFELTVMLPLLADICVHSGQPLFPHDVQQALIRMPAPRCLVSTPQHLQAMLGSGLEFPNVERVFCATAPMDKELAEKVEHRFGASVIEIYGCSEVGSIARRHTAKDNAWTPFSAMTITSTNGRTTVQAPHLESEIELQDVIVLQSDGTFTLSGRLADLINIAGKRGSLSQINQHLNAIPEVVDGVIFDPDIEPGKKGMKRLAAIVVASNIDKSALLARLSDNLDPVFLPRPVVFADSLPRNETGKLTRQAVLSLYESLR